jgi:hypothetical protein
LRHFFQKLSDHHILRQDKLFDCVTFLRSFRITSFYVSTCAGAAFFSEPFAATAFFGPLVAATFFFVPFVATAAVPSFFFFAASFFAASLSF